MSSLAHGVGNMRATTPDTPQTYSVVVTPDTPQTYDAVVSPETSTETSPETTPKTSVPAGHTAPYVGQIVMYRSVLHQVCHCHVFGIFFLQTRSDSAACLYCSRAQIKEMHTEKGDEGPSCILWRSYPVHQYTIAHADMHLVPPAPGVFYVTNENDSIAGVAKNHSVTPASLVSANAHLNGITRRSKFHANTILYIPS